jgi:AcrR family transcriptional regulator
VSRADTEAELEAAALALLRRDGVLAGLNLREVADEAGVNRGLVYHYFGSRQELLRAALRKDARRRLEEVRSGGKLPFAARWRRFLRLMTSQRDVVRLMTLLVLDDDAELRTMPLRHETRQLLEADRDRGSLAADADLEATHAAIVSFTYGYLVYQGALAREFGMSVEELDERIAVVFDRMLRGLAPVVAAPSAPPDP